MTHFCQISIIIEFPILQRWCLNKTFPILLKKHELAPNNPRFYWTYTKTYKVMNDALADKLIELFKNARTKLDSIVEEIPRSSDQLNSMTTSLLIKTKIELRKYSTEVAALISNAKKNGEDVTKAAYDKITKDVELIVSKAKKN